MQKSLAWDRDHRKHRLEKEVRKTAARQTKTTRPAAALTLWF
jgi:hypothetical protein